MTVLALKLSQKSIDSSALLWGLMQKTEALLTLNIKKINKKKILGFEHFSPLHQAETLAALSSIKSYGSLLKFLSEELDHVLIQRSGELQLGANNES